MFVKKLNQDDWQGYRAVRLEALARHEGSYGGSYKDEAAWTDEQWRGFMADGKHAFFGLFDKSDMVGIGAVFTDRIDRTGKTALLAAGYIRESHRGHGHSSLIYEARINWIIGCGHFDRIAVGHKDGNEASRRANQRFGFQHTGRQEKQWGDGSAGVIHNYEMRLR